MEKKNYAYGSWFCMQNFIENELLTCDVNQQCKEKENKKKFCLWKLLQIKH